VRGRREGVREGKERGGERGARTEEREGERERERGLAPPPCTYMYFMAVVLALNHSSFCFSTVLQSNFANT